MEAGAALPLNLKGRWPGRAAGAAPHRFKPFPIALRSLRKFSQNINMTHL